MMPGEDGFAVIKALKNNSHTAAIPVIFLTGVSEIRSKLEGFELGAVDYITKPFHAQEVSARVRLHLKLSIATNSLIASQAHKLRQIQEAQTSMLVSPDEIPDANFGIYYLSLQEAGGDFYDVLPISDDIYGYFVGDFAGHDIKTSYLTSSVKALLKQNCTPVYQPLETIKLINDVLADVLPTGKYLTACYARLNRKAKQLTIVSCGHPPAVFVPKGGEPRLIEMEGDILGMFTDVVFGKEQLKVKKGDRFYLYSDGLVESPDQKIVWSEGLEIMLQTCDNARDVNIQDAPSKIMGEIFEDTSNLDDDVVLLAIEV
jgi:sigma-B regulation protein RsbU (phosphoserine phosphatase)